MSRIKIDLKNATTEQVAAQLLTILRENISGRVSVGYYQGCLESILQFEFAPVALGLDVRGGVLCQPGGAFSSYGGDRGPEWLRKKYNEAVNWLRKNDYIVRDHTQRDDQFAEATAEGAAVEIDAGSMSFVIPRPWKHWLSGYARGVFLLSVVKGGREHTGTAFQIGPNLFATCEHNFVGDVSIYVGEEAVPALAPKKHPSADVAVFSLDRPPGDGFPPLPVRNALPDPGDEVAILGFPVVPQRLPTLNFCAGMVESLPTDYKATLQYVQVSIPTAGGYSGGPLIDAYGRVVGVVSERTFEDVSEAKMPARPFSQVVPARYLAELI